MANNEPLTTSETESQASPSGMGAAERQPLTREHKDHLLGFLKILKDHKHARMFLDQAHLDALRLPRYPEIIKPIFDLGTIERKLRENQYHAIEDLIDDFKYMVGYAYQQWGRSVI
jgi:bromodomain-containing factor 1